MCNLDNVRFESAFDQYLTEAIHEEIEETIFKITKDAFTAGWNSAMQLEK